jgi:hypothetical protein
VRPATNFGQCGIQIKYISTETTPAASQRKNFSSASSTKDFSDGFKATEEGPTRDYWSNTLSVMSERAVSLGQRGLRIYLQARRVHPLVHRQHFSRWKSEKFILNSELLTDVLMTIHQSKLLLEP